jgi:hypothetical protein
MSNGDEEEEQEQATLVDYMYAATFLAPGESLMDWQAACEHVTHLRLVFRAQQNVSSVYVKVL